MKSLTNYIKVNKLPLISLSEKLVVNKDYVPNISVKDLYDMIKKNKREFGDIFFINSSDANSEIYITNIIESIHEIQYNYVGDPNNPLHEDRDKIIDTYKNFSYPESIDSDEYDTMVACCYIQKTSINNKQIQDLLNSFDYDEIPTKNSDVKFIINEEEGKDANLIIGCVRTKGSHITEVMHLCIVMYNYNKQ